MFHVFCISVGTGLIFVGLTIMQQSLRTMRQCWQERQVRKELEAIADAGLKLEEMVALPEDAQCSA